MGNTYQTAAVSEHLVDNDVVRNNPAHPVEERERLEDVSGEEIPTRRGKETVEEEPFTANTTTVSDTGVLLLMESIEQRASDQIRRPDWVAARYGGVTGEAQ